VPVAAATPPIGRFRLVGKPRRRSDGGLSVRVYAPAAGRFTARGLGPRAAVRPASGQAAKAGTLTVIVRLSKAGRALLRKKPRVRVKAALAFTPVGGKTQRATQTLTLQRPRG
jgi:hypothetical protein